MFCAVKFSCDCGEMLGEHTTIYRFKKQQSFQRKLPFQVIGETKQRKRNDDNIQQSNDDHGHGNEN